MKLRRVAVELFCLALSAGLAAAPPDAPASDEVNVARLRSPSIKQSPEGPVSFLISYGGAHVAELRTSAGIAFELTGNLGIVDTATKVLVVSNAATLKIVLGTNLVSLTADAIQRGDAKESQAIETPLYYLLKSGGELLGKLHVRPGATPVYVKGRDPLSRVQWDPSGTFHGTGGVILQIGKGPKLVTVTADEIECRLKPR